MAAPAFDTLRFVRTLREKAKLTNEQAEGSADAIGEAAQGDLATKSDVADLRSDAVATRASLKAEIDAVRSELRQTELRIEAKIEASRSDLLKWIVGAIGFQTVVILGALIALLRVARP